MDKQTIAEQAHRILVSGDITSESDIKIQEVRLAAGQILDQVLVEYLIQVNRFEKNVGFRIPNNLLKTSSVALSSNSGTLPAYLELPNDSGIQEVTITDGSTVEALYPIHSRLGLSDGLESTSLEGSGGYRITWETITVLQDNAVSTCSVTYVPSAAGATDSTTLNYPDQVSEMAINRIVKMFAPHIEIKSDDVIDNKDPN